MADISEGPVFSPLASGWISGHISWRWVYWISLLFSFAAFLLALLLLPETFAPVLNDWNQPQIGRPAGNKMKKVSSKQSEPLSARLWENVTRPAKFFRSESIIIFLGSYLILIYVVNFTFLSGFTFIYTHTYDLSDGK